MEGAAQVTGPLVRPEDPRLSRAQTAAAMKPRDRKRSVNQHLARRRQIKVRAERRQRNCQEALQRLAFENRKLAKDVNNGLRLHIDQELAIMELQESLKKATKAEDLAKTACDAAQSQAESFHRQWRALYRIQNPNSYYDEDAADIDGRSVQDQPEAIDRYALPDSQMAVDNDDGDSLPDYEDNDDDEQPDIGNNMPQQNTTYFSQEVMDTNSGFQDANSSLRPQELLGQRLHSSSNGPRVTVQVPVDRQLEVGMGDIPNQAEIETDNDNREDWGRQEVTTTPQDVSARLPGVFERWTTPRITVHAPTSLIDQPADPVEATPAPGSPTRQIDGSDDIELADMLGDASITGHSVGSLIGAMADTTLTDDTAAVENGGSSDSQFQPQQYLSPRNAEQQMRQPLQDLTNARDIAIGSSSRPGVLSAFNRREAKAPESLGGSG
jgi:hypothetical protein